MSDVSVSPRHPWLPNAPARPLHQVLLLADAHSRYAGLAPALVAAFVEVELFFAAGGVQLATARTVLADAVVNASLALPGVTLTDAPPYPEVLEALRTRTQGSYRRTVDQNRLAQVLRELLSLPPDVHLQVVTDIEIIPPPEWRYLIWDDVDNGTVVAIPPTDPNYWQVKDEHRVATVKHRVRTACISSIGEWLGLARCEVMSCLMYAHVDAAARLDTMRRLGSEHGELPGLHGRGYSPAPERPLEVQPLEQRPPVAGGGGTLRFINGRLDTKQYLKAPDLDFEDL